ncbi:MAG: hypothetical protein KJ804_16540 [Proteobacteria bacterium]|nr:hypothetical protein [Pseudomonadota bacterium]MBU1059916.1 hypothetical protein [Pseudomonadota bacterium]
MANAISNQAHLNPHELRQHNNKNLNRLADKQTTNPNKPITGSDSVTISRHQEVSMTYSSSLTIQTETSQDQYSLLRGLVVNMLKEQGIEFQAANGTQKIDISSLSPEEATELIGEDGYFGVGQTSDRIVDFAIAVAGGDPSRLAAIKEGVENGFSEALDAFGGSLPDISYETYDAVMNKLDTWANVDSQEQVS